MKAAERRRISTLLPLIALAVLLACGLTGAPAQAQLFEAAGFSDPSENAPASGSLFLTDGNHLLTAPAFTTPATILVTMVRNPRTGQLFAIGSTLAGSRLVHVDFQTGAIDPFGAPLTTEIRSLAFDSKGNLYAFAFCDTTYPNALFTMDPASGNLTGLLGSLDSGQLGPCGSSLTGGAQIAIDPSDDTLYFVGQDAIGNAFVDRMSPTLVPTTIATSILSLFGLTPPVPTAATFANGRLFIAFAGSFVGPGLGFASLDPANSSAGFVTTSGAAYRALTYDNNAAVLGLVATPPSCAASTTAACLFNRFKVAATYDATPDNGSGPATVLLESSQTVKFSFFDPTNVELILKMVDACSPPFNQWWVSGGGLTNVGVQIHVTDTNTGAVKTYASTKGQLFQPFFDTAAFPCP